MSVSTVAKLEEVLRSLGFDWIVQSDRAAERMKAIDHDINEFAKAYQARFHTTPAPYELFRENRRLGSWFFRIISGARLSVPMRVMLWRLLSGATILRLSVEFDRAARRFRFRVTLRMKDTEEPDPEYVSENPWDYRILKHLSLMLSGDDPILIGVFADQAP